MQMSLIIPALHRALHRFSDSYSNTHSSPPKHNIMLSVYHHSIYKSTIRIFTYRSPLPKVKTCRFTNNLPLLFRRSSRLASLCFMQKAAGRRFPGLIQKLPAVGLPHAHAKALPHSLCAPVKAAPPPPADMSSPVLST